MPDDAMSNALTGDMSGINDWGEEVQPARSRIIASEIKRAKGGAPNDETVKALDDAIASSTSSPTSRRSPRTATDFDILHGRHGIDTDHFEALDATMTDAGDTLDEATADYCN